MFMRQVIKHQIRINIKTVKQSDLFCLEAVYNPSKNGDKFLSSTLDFFAAS